MHINVITISRTLGAGGDDLGTLLADELGFRYVDSEILDRAAALAGATPEELAKVEERHGLMARVLENLGQAATAVAVGEGIPVSRPVGGEHAYQQLIIDVIKETADMQFVVIVAHGAGIPLAGRPGLFRIMVTASKDTRVKRIASDRGLSEHDARRVVEESDAARADYFRRFFRLEHETPTNYDLLINTDTLDVAHAAKGVLAIVEA